MNGTIDIIVPVYRGDAETRACLDGVLACRVLVAHHVIVVDDASPEPALSQWLRELEQAGRIELLVHCANRGFVASVNEAMALHPDRDVVLLNSDTEVSDGWLDRLSAHAARDATIGTATPFSTNATICSYPRILEANPLPAGETTASLDAAFAAANAGMNAPIPTAVGFCMFIARRCLDATGPFDEARYGVGYGEEVDFCMRAARAGFRHVVAGDVFVRHVGEVSFGVHGAERRERAQATIDELYPEFRPALSAFLQREPLRELRRRADLERLRRSPRPRLLFASHAYAGGVRRHIGDLAAMLGPDAEVLLLQPAAGSRVAIRWLREGEEFALWFHEDRDRDSLEALLRSLDIARVHVHHVHGLPRWILELPGRLGSPHDVTLHDYYPACPTYHLTDAHGRYCGGAPDCGQCLDAAPAQWALSIPEWRAAFRALLASAARVIAPSRDVAERIARFFPGIAPVVWPHPEDAKAPPPTPARILVPGAISTAKGLDVLEACVRDAAARELPLHFRVLGYTSRPIASWPALPYSIAGEYREGDLAALIAQEGGDALFFPAQCAETYSYTLTAALASGLPIVATDLGALPERLAGHPAASIVPWDAPASVMNEAILARTAPSTRSSSTASVPPMTCAAYRARYLEGIVPRGAPGPRAALDPAWLAEPIAHPVERPLAWLFEDAVRCGRGQSLEELQRRVAEADRRITQAEREAGELVAARAALAEREAALQAASAAREREAAESARLHERLADVESSRSWRLTRPLRALARRLRRDA